MVELEPSCVQLGLTVESKVAVPADSDQVMVNASPPSVYVPASTTSVKSLNVGVAVAAVGAVVLSSIASLNELVSRSNVPSANHSFATLKTVTSPVAIL